MASGRVKGQAYTTPWNNMSLLPIVAMSCGFVGMPESNLIVIQVVYSLKFLNAYPLVAPKWSLEVHSWVSNLLTVVVAKYVHTQFQPFTCLKHNSNNTQHIFTHPSI